MDVKNENDRVVQELQKLRSVATVMKKEVDYKNEKVYELERKHERACNDLREARNLVAILSNEIDNKKGRLCFLEMKHHEAVSELKRLSSDNDRLHNLLIERTQQREFLFNENKKLRSKLQAQLREFKSNLEKRAHQNDSEKRILLLEKQKLELRQQHTDEINELRKVLKEVEDELQDADGLIHALTVKEIKSNQELQDARKEAICGVSGILSNRTNLTIKRMGEIDQKAFQETCLVKFFEQDWEGISAKMCSEWEEYVRDPHWQPFKVVEGQQQASANYTNALFCST